MNWLRQVNWKRSSPQERSKLELFGSGERGVNCLHVYWYVACCLNVGVQGHGKPNYIFECPR